MTSALHDRLKRVLAIHDISCFGKCSLTVALPIVSASGLECTVLPNVLLSTHTGINGFTYRDLTDEMGRIMDHLRSLDLKFDSVFTGFLSSREQVDFVIDIVKEVRDEGGLAYVDPAMADNGELYSVFGPEFPGHMRRLCSLADVIKPNVTEACLMLGSEYREGPYGRDYVEELLDRLSAIGAGKVILTGVGFDEDEIGAAAYDCETGETEYHLRRKIPGYYVGTGDIFSSVAVSAMMRGKGFGESVRLAVDFTADSIQRTYDAGTDPMFGVDFEHGIPDLVARLDQCIGRRSA